MNITTTSKSLLACMALVLAMLAFFPLSSDAQTLKRGVLIEEPTGQWCGHCPLGAWYMDSLQKLMGDNAVIISWHNSDVMENQESIDWHTAFGINSWPGYVFNRYYKGGFGSVLLNGKAEVAFAASQGLAKQAMDSAKKAPQADFRIVNVAFDNNHLDFDLDITPYDVTKMRSEDTAQYVTVAILTEDNVSAYQHNYGYDGGANPSDIDPFLHQNVERTAVSDIMGDKITLNLASATPTFPIRKHYTALIDGGSWNSAMVKAKVALVVQNPKNKTPKTNTVLDARQTKYAATYPASAPDAVWIVLPNANTTTKPNVPINIIWAAGGLNQATAVKLDYTTDNGTTWNSIVGNTSASPYSWTIPTVAYGYQMKIRASNASIAGINGSSDAFPTPGIINVVKPVAGAVFSTGDATTIEITGGNYGNSKTFEVSDDNMATWKTIGVISTDVKSFPWNVGMTFAGVDLGLKTTTEAFIRVKDANGVVGVSGKFTINAVAVGKIQNVVVNNVVNNHLDKAKTTITWSPTGELGTNVLVEYTYNNGIQWSTIGTVPAAANTIEWTPDIDKHEVWVRVKPDKGSAGESAKFSVGVNAIQNLKLVGLNANNEIEVNKPLTINWHISGEVASLALTLEYSTNGTTNWTTLDNQLTPTTETTQWTFTSTMPSVYVRVKGDYTDAGTAMSGQFKVVSQGAVYSETPVGGYSITNYPNPVNSSTTIAFTMAERGYVTLSLRDELGREVARIANATYEAGSQQIAFDASKLTAGIYSCTMETNGVHLVKKLTVTK